MTPVHWKVLECIFIKAGFTFKRQQGSHRLYEKEGILRPITIPMYREIQLDIIQSNIRTAKMPRDKYFELLAVCK